MNKFVRVIWFCFDYHCGFTLNKIYEVYENVINFPDGSSGTEEYSIDNEGRMNFSIMNCVKTEVV